MPRMPVNNKTQKEKRKKEKERDGGVAPPSTPIAKGGTPCKGGWGGSISTAGGWPQESLSLLRCGPPARVEWVVPPPFTPDKGWQWGWSHPSILFSTFFFCVFFICKYTWHDDITFNTH